MKKVLFLFFCTYFVSICSAQIYPRNKKRSFKSEAYILNGADTINGWIVVPVSNDWVDYYSLRTNVVFVDSSNKQKKYKPGDIAGFGFREDKALGEYTSASEAKGLPKSMFLRCLLQGKASLYEDKQDRSVIKSYGAGTTSFGPPSATVQRPVDIHKSLIYIKHNDDAFINIKFDSKTDKVKKKELKKLLDFLPDSFKDSKDEVDISGLIEILTEFNSTP